MSHRRRRGLLAVLLAVALFAVPLTATSGASKKSEAKQNSAIKKNKRAIKKANAAIKSLRKVAKGLNTRTASIDKRVKTIEAAVPLVTSALTQLKNGLTAAGAGLNSLKTFVTSDEYGFGQVLVAQPAVAAEAGSFIETPNIPDDVQQAQTSQQFTAQHTGTVVVAYGVRSNESDGTGAANPAAVCRVWVSKGTTLDQTAANAGLGGLPFQPVPTKSAMTSTTPANAGFPFGLKTSGADADQTTNFTSTVNVAAGDLYTVGMSCVDTSPNPNDPSA